MKQAGSMCVYLDCLLYYFYYSFYNFKIWLNEKIPCTLSTLKLESQVYLRVLQLLKSLQKMGATQGLVLYAIYAASWRKASAQKQILRRSSDNVYRTRRVYSRVKGRMDLAAQM